MILLMGMSMGRMSGEQMHHAALYMADTLAPGETKTFDYTFKQSMMGQRFEFTCNPPGQYGAMMRFPIAIHD
jgi:uncharacterized cupredoxin-like copper-binding protein